MRSFWGLMRAYWLSERWKEAWILTVIIALLTAAASKASVWMAEASAELINSIAFFHDPSNESPMPTLLASAGTLLLLVLLKDAGFIGLRHLCSTTLHRKWRRWLDGRFNAALLDGNHTHYHLQHEGSDGAGRRLDNVDQRLQECIKDMTGGAIGLAMGVVGVTMSLFFVGQKLIETSTAVRGLEFLGDYAGAVLGLAAVAFYVPLNTLIAFKLGKVLERLTVRLQQTEGSYRAELTTFLRRSFVIASAKGETVQKDMHDKLYGEIDQTWAGLNKINATYISFELVYNFMAARIVSYGPGLLSYMHGNINLKTYVTGAELINALIQQCSWFIQVMPAIANLRANSRRMIDLAEAIEAVQNPPDFYGQSGCSEFRSATQHAVFGITLRNVELMHRGEEQPFLTIPNLRFRRGEWTMLKGESGCGKTSLIKAINGLWPHGRGDIVLPEGARSFYAAQEVKLPSLTLKQLVCLPDRDSEHSDTQVAAALHKAGLGGFIEHVPNAACEGKPWDQVLSGGQKQKLMLARILLHRPSVLFLDEATAALDPESKVAFHQAIKDNCPDVTVISVMHEAEPPRAESGVPFYSSIVRIEGRTAIKMPAERRYPGDLVAKARPEIDSARPSRLSLFAPARRRQREWV